MLLGLQNGRDYLAGVTEGPEGLGDVGQLRTTLFINVVHYEYRVTSSSDFALGAAQAYARRNVEEDIARLATFYSRDERDVRAEQYSLRNCELL